MFMLPQTTTQHYLVWIRLQLKISFVTSFTISKWLKKYCISYQIYLWKQVWHVFEWKQRYVYWLCSIPYKSVLIKKKLEALTRIILTIKQLS